MIHSNKRIIKVLIRLRGYAFVVRKPLKTGFLASMPIWNQIRLLPKEQSHQASIMCLWIYTTALLSGWHFLDQSILGLDSSFSLSLVEELNSILDCRRHWLIAPREIDWINNIPGLTMMQREIKSLMEKWNYIWSQQIIHKTLNLWVYLTYTKLYIIERYKI